MTDDIVTRLRRAFDIWLSHGEVDDLAWRDAADEIERLRGIIQPIITAVTDEGRSPAYHRQQANYVRTMWFPLWKAISNAVKEFK